MRRAAALAALLGAILLGACGSTTTVQERPVTVTGPVRSPSADTTAPRHASSIRIAVITHGQASSAFWAVVRNGAQAAGRQMGVAVTYRAPDVYSLRHMIALIDEAIVNRPSGLVVSLPDPGLAPAIRRAVRAGIPTVTINSGSTMVRRLGVLAHVGQPEEPAGYKAGRRLAALGVRRALCVNLLIDNVGLDARCTGLARAMRSVGGTSTVMRLDDMAPDAPQRIAGEVRRTGADGVLALNAMSGVAASEGLRGQHVRAGAFDLTPDVLRAVQAGRLAFAVDQQAYLQGYLPVVLLAQRARYGLFPDQGEVIATGPSFVTKANAAQALRLSERSIR